MDLSSVKFLAPNAGKGGAGKRKRQGKGAQSAPKRGKKGKGGAKKMGKGGRPVRPNGARGGGAKRAKTPIAKPVPSVRAGARDPFKASSAPSNAAKAVGVEREAGGKALSKSVMGLKFMAHVKAATEKKDDEGALLEAARAKQAAAVSFLGEASSRFVCVRDDAVGNELGGRVRSSGRRSFIPTVQREEKDEGTSSVTASQMAARFSSFVGDRR